MLKINLEALKASGVYTYEFDASTTVSEISEFGRLAIGSNKQGPFNTVVKLSNDTLRKNIYGQNDKLLEKKGSYFCKSLEVLLREGPVYALNILPVELQEDTESVKNLDRGSITTFNTECADINGAGIISDKGTSPLLPVSVPLINLYNRQKLWYASDIEVTRTKNRKIASDSNKILTFANMSQKQVTVFVRKANIQGYDLTVSEWYSFLGPDVTIPAFLHKDDLISDYMVNVIVVSGDWTNYRKLETDPVFSKYFDNDGIINQNINEFLQLKTVNVISNVNGCLIPDFTDTSNNNIAIDVVFNNMYPLTQMICALDTSKMDTIDLTSELYDEDDMSTRRIDIVGNGVTESENYIDDGTNVLIDVLSYRKPITNIFEYDIDTIIGGGSPTLESIIIEETAGSPSFTYIKAFESSNLYKCYEGGFINNGDIIDGTPDIYIKINTGSDLIGKYIVISGYSDNTLLTQTDLVGISDTSVTFTTSATKYSSTIALSLFDSYESLAPNKLKLEITNLTNNQKTSIFEYIKVGSYIKAEVDSVRSRNLKIISVATSVEATKTFIIIDTLAPSDITVLGIDLNINATPQIVLFKGVQNFVAKLNGLKLDPFKVRESLLPNGTSTRQNEILKFMFDTNIAEAITESEDIDIRYIVDTFDGDISYQSKYYLSRLAATHAKSMAFINTPSMKQFEVSTTPVFIDVNTGLIKTEYIATGGNLSLNPSFTYRFASDTINGVPMESYTIPAFPYLTINENGANKSMIPAPYVCNAYIRKFKANSPYAVIAGDNGRITDSDVIGVEYELTNDDRKNLEPIGYNLLVKKRRGGVMLFSNNTAYQRVKSALNNAHVRDTLITLEKNIENTLFAFLFKYNTPILRVRVKSLVDSYLEGVQFNGGIAWFETQIDENNNDAYVLENNSAVIDIKIDFNRSINKFVNKITITRTGGQLSISQSGFGAI
jgi:hypothetical protein